MYFVWQSKVLFHFQSYNFVFLLIESIDYWRSFVCLYRSFVFCESWDCYLAMVDDFFYLYILNSFVDFMHLHHLGFQLYIEKHFPCWRSSNANSDLKGSWCTKAMNSWVSFNYFKLNGILKLKRYTSMHRILLDWNQGRNLGERLRGKSFEL